MSRLIIIPALAALLLSAAKAEPLFLADAADQDDMDLQITQDLSYPGNPYYVRGSVLIDAPAERIWALMTDCEATEQIVPQLRHCEIEIEGDGWDHRRHDVKSGPFRIRSVFRSDYEPLKNIRISRVSGDLEIQEGVWSLSPREDGLVELSYEAWSKPKFWVPRWFIARSIKRDAPRILANLKSMAERSTG
ncbi:MAG: SRPBCC family protein [Pseudomonadota bacterium]